MSFVEQPKLSTWGIEEIEANTCEDNALHRRILNNNKIPFRIFEPGVIEVLFENYDELNAHHESVYERKKLILTNPRDAWSDYVPFDELPLDFLETAPAWIQRHLNKYNDALAEGVKPDKLPILPKRCKRRRADGSRCWNWEWPAKSSEGFCKGHSKFGAFNVMDQMNRLNDAAKVRLGQMSPEAVAVLEDLMMNSEVPHVRLKAATEVLDRIGIRGGTELTVSGHVTHEVEDPAAVVRGRLEQLAERAEAASIPKSHDEHGTEILALPVVQGEVVERSTDD